MPYSAEELKAERIRRRLAAIRLRDFTKYTFPEYINCKHQDVLNEKLEAVERYVNSGGKDGIGRLIVSMPPRHGKSQKISCHFPAWFLGRHPDMRVILASYGADLAEFWSKKARDLVESKEYQNVFSDINSENPVFVDDEKRRVQSWDLKGKRGGFVAAGVGGAITGKGADILIIDDPVKDREEADSETMQEKVWDWFTSTAYTRLQRPHGAVIIMMTRWSENDLVGKLLEKEPEKWEVLNLPMIAEEGDGIGRNPGEILWPEVFSQQTVDDIKSTLPPRDWISLYQQRPSAGDGEIFKREWIRYGPMPPKDEITKAIQIWDTALTEKEESDFSACVTAFVTRDGIYIADVFRERMAFPKLKQRMQDLYYHWNEKFPISRIYIEHKVSGISVLQSLKSETHLPVMPLERDTILGKSKVQRAGAVSGYVESGRITLRENAPWLDQFEQELFGFPRGKHDDMVDAFVYAVITLRGGARPPKRNRPNQERYIDMDGQVIQRDRHADLMGGWAS